MSLVLRFVDKDYNVREDFVRFIQCRLGFRGGSRIFLTLVQKDADEVGIHDAVGVVKINWDFGGRCEPTNGVWGKAPKALAILAFSTPKTAFS